MDDRFKFRVWYEPTQKYLPLDYIFIHGLDGSVLDTELDDFYEPSTITKEQCMAIPDEDINSTVKTMMKK